MSCASPSLTVESYEDLPSATASGTSKNEKPTIQRRRHSSFHPRRKSTATDHGSADGEDRLWMKVDTFLCELERRLDFLDNYSALNIDASVSRAYATLQAVRARCSQMSGEVLGEGRRKARVMVETVEARYQEALAAKETMGEKVHTGMGLLESMLSDFEAKAYKMREQGFANAAGTLMEDGRKAVDGRIERAREAIDGSIERARQAAGTLEEHIENALKRARKNGLIHYEDLPIPWRGNPYIMKGYRFCGTKFDCVKSMFGVSNEFINIWSHGIGLFIVLAIAFYIYPSSANFGLSTKTDVFIAALFFAAACKCMVCSTMWHTMSSVADQTQLERFACVDYTGISVLIAASIMTTEYTAFYCEPVTRWFWLTTTATLGIAGVFLTWHPYFNRPDMAWARVAFYCTLGATGFVPVFQVALTRGSAWAWDFYWPIAKSLIMYLGGAFIYASHVPERWYPGAFDYIGGSHNIWHFAVLLGIVNHYLALQSFFGRAFERAQNECMTY